MQYFWVKKYYQQYIDKYLQLIEWIDLNFKKNILDLQTKFTQKMYFRFKAGQINITNKFSIFELCLVASVMWNRQFQFFWIKFALKGNFPHKAGKININTEISIFKLLFVPMSSSYSNYLWYQRLS